MLTKIVKITFYPHFQKKNSHFILYTNFLIYPSSHKFSSTISDFFSFFCCSIFFSLDSNYFCFTWASSFTKAYWFFFLFISSVSYLLKLFPTISHVIVSLLISYSNCWALSLSLSPFARFSSHFEFSYSFGLFYLKFHLGISYIPRVQTLKILY